MVEKREQKNHPEEKGFPYYFVPPQQQNYQNIHQTYQTHGEPFARNQPAPFNYQYPAVGQNIPKKPLRNVWPPFLPNEGLPNYEIADLVNYNPFNNPGAESVNMEQNLNERPPSINEQLKLNPLNFPSQKLPQSFNIPRLQNTPEIQTKTQQLIEHLDLNHFKLHPCTKSAQHNHKHCPFFHNHKDRKRNGNFYSADLCENIEKNEICRLGDFCTKSHNRVEQLYREEKYKTKFCSFYPNNIHKCEYGNYCSFAHHENDIIIELIHNFEYDDDFYMFHFKTVWCPFNLTQHDKGLCVYAHNWQDFRRKPNIYEYEPVPCQNWRSNDFIFNYEEGCSNSYKCTKCHGWKENEYHPLNYKTKICPNGRSCQKGSDCPHFHTNKDKRFTIFFF